MVVIVLHSLILAFFDFSMWKDIFSSDVTPLDFDAPKSTKKRKKIEEHLLVEVYKSKNCIR